jgi:hypothetical protein
LSVIPQFLEVPVKSKQLLRSHAAALMLLAPVAATLVAQPAAAQQRAVVAQPSIVTMSLNADAGLSPGSTLRLQVTATRNAKRASVTLGDGGVVVPLQQTAAGTYTGSYVVRRADRIDPTQLMTARVTFGDRVYARQFNFPSGFQAQAMGAAPAAAPATHAAAIERFVMRPVGRLEPGRELRFRLHGMPGADAWLDIPGVISGVDLAETRPGVYEGSYTVRRRDNPDAFRNAIATLRNGNQRATAKVDMNWREQEGGRDERVGAREDRLPAREERMPMRDERAPQITDLLPANGDRLPDRGRTQVGARLSDEGSGVDPANVRIRLNGRDVTDDARVTPDEVQYRGDLGPGRYRVEISVKDLAGNTTTKSWGFDVAAGG